MPKVPYPYKVNGKLVAGNGSLIPICSLSNRSLLPSLTVLLIYWFFFSIFQNYGLLEEKQAKERSPIQDSKNFELTCNQMKEVLSKVYETKQSGRKSTEVLSELKTDFLMHFLTLKKLNRHNEPKFENLIQKLFILLCH